MVTLYVGLQCILLSDPIYILVKPTWHLYMKLKLPQNSPDIAPEAIPVPVSEPSSAAAIGAEAISEAVAVAEPVLAAVGSKPIYRRKLTIFIMLIG